MTNKYLEKIEEHKIYDAVFEENKKPEKTKSKEGKIHDTRRNKKIYSNIKKTKKTRKRHKEIIIKKGSTKGKHSTKKIKD
jgi:hypothetical protein